MKKEKVQQNELAEFLGLKPGEIEELKTIDFDKARASIATTRKVAKDMKLFLKLAKISYAELAEELGTNKSNVNNWIKKPTSWDLQALDRALGYIKKKWPFKIKT